MEEYNDIIKISIVRYAGNGKTSLMKNFTDNIFSDNST